MLEIEILDLDVRFLFIDNFSIFYTNLKSIELLLYLKVLLSGEDLYCSAFGFTYRIYCNYNVGSVLNAANVWRKGKTVCTLV